MENLFIRIKNWLTKQLLEDSIPISLIILLFGVTIITFLYRLVPSLQEGYFAGIFVEFTGMMFDILIFGLMIALYTRLTTRHSEIKRQREIIDDFKKWNSEEGKLRIAGAVRRINRLGRTDIDFCGILLRDFSFFEADISSIAGSAFFPRIKKDRIENFKISSIVTRLEDISFQYTDCTQVIFSDGKKTFPLKNLHFANANLSNAMFNGAVLVYDKKQEQMKAGELIHGQFEGANLTGTSFKNVTFQTCDFRGAKNIEKAIFTDASGLETCKFDNGVRKKVMALAIVHSDDTKN